MCQAALGSPHFHLLLQLETGTLLSDLAIIFLALCNNLFYTQLAFVFHLQKEFYVVLLKEVITQRCTTNYFYVGKLSFN